MKSNTSVALRIIPVKASAPWPEGNPERNLNKNYYKKDAVNINTCLNCPYPNCRVGRCNLVKGVK